MITEEGSFKTWEIDPYGNYQHHKIKYQYNFINSFSKVTIDIFTLILTFNILYLYIHLFVGF